MADKNERGTQGIPRRNNIRSAELGLTMRLSDAGSRRRPTKLIYPHHRPPPWRNEVATPRSLEPIVRRQPQRIRLG